MSRDDDVSYEYCARCGKDFEADEEELDEWGHCQKCAEIIFEEEEDDD